MTTKTSSGCRSVSPDVAQLDCVMTNTHTGDHRGVLWLDGKPSDHYWPREGAT